MERVSILLLLSCFLVAAIHAGDLDTCARNYKRVGCFTEKSDQSSNMLIYDRYGIQWKNIKAYMHSLACRCETKARMNKKYAGFAIHFWGECYGKTQAQLDAVNGKTESLECTGDQKYDGCAADAKECAGHAFTDFVYVLKSVSELEKAICSEVDASIECKDGKKLELIEGSYGPRTSAVCGSPVTVGWEQKCEVLSSVDFTYYKNFCNGEKSCSVSGWTTPSSDPCKDKKKRLNIKYICKA